MSADGAGGGGGEKQKFELYIKASAIDKETKGSCPICQHWFMITCLLGENQDDIDFKVYTVQADCPPKNFGVEQGWSKKFPVVMVLEGRDKKGQDLTGTKYDTFEELETFFESINRECPELKRKNSPNISAMQAVEDLYNAFNTFLSTGGKSSKRLNTALKKINEFLESDDCKFLVDNVLSFADCYILPRLQHVRVAGREYLNYDIPLEYTAIWKYLREAYKMEAFRSTMPSDQDVVFHYEKKAKNLQQAPKKRVRPTLQNFTYTMDIPEEIAQKLQESESETSPNGDVDKPPEPTDQANDTDNSLQQQEEPSPSFEQEVAPSPQADHDGQVAVDQDVVQEVSKNEEVVDEPPPAEQATLEVARDEEEVRAEEGAEEMVRVEQATNEAVSGQEQEAVEAFSGQEAVEEEVRGQEAADELVKEQESVYVNVTPGVADDVAVEDNITTEESQQVQVSGTTDGGDDVENAVTANSVGGSDAADDQVTQVHTDADMGVKITVGQEEDVKNEMGNGDVIGEKGDSAVTKSDDELAKVEG